MSVPLSPNDAEERVRVQVFGVDGDALATGWFNAGERIHFVQHSDGTWYPVSERYLGRKQVNGEPARDLAAEGYRPMPWVAVQVDCETGEPVSASNAPWWSRVWRWMKGG